jgi:predicted ATPase
MRNSRAIESCGSPLLGRKDEQFRLEELLQRVFCGASHVVHVLGEPGIGKSRLLGYLGEQGRGTGFQVESARATELEQDVPFRVFVDALQPLLARLEPWQHDRLATDWGNELGTFIPAFRGTLQRSFISPPAERYRIHQAVRDVLGRVAVARPLLVIFDDVHWADVASLELLESLSDQLPDARVLVALASRPEQTAQTLLLATHRAAREGRAMRIELGPLDRAAAQALVGGGRGHFDIEALCGFRACRATIPP